MLKIGHSVTRPGRKLGDGSMTITVPEELETVPGIPQNPPDVDFYSREYPIESQQIDYTADREWVWSVYSKEVLEDRRIHDRLNKPIVMAAKDTGDMEPTADPVPQKDITDEIKTRARELVLARWGLPSTTGATSTSIRGAGSSSPTLSALPTSSPTSPPSRRPASRPRVPTSGV